jgi:hypothetical protein
LHQGAFVESVSAAVNAFGQAADDMGVHLTDLEVDVTQFQYEIQPHQHLYRAMVVGLLDLGDGKGAIV